VSEADRFMRALAEPWAAGAPPRRFYQRVSVEAASGGFVIALDGRRLPTPMKRPLVLPRRGLAEAVAAEWECQIGRIDHSRMPLTRLANTAIDRVAPDTARIIAEIVQYAGSDLLCYRAAEPHRLALRQAERWDPLLAWAERALGARLIAVVGVVHQPQPHAALDAFRGRLEDSDAFRLTALHNLTTLTGSAVIAAALAKRHIAADAAWAAAHVDEDWQIEHWGQDDIAEARRRARRAEFDTAMRLLELAG
jgi:chaperone required for assembly of F1-ATPase